MIQRGAVLAVAAVLAHALTGCTSEAGRPADPSPSPGLRLSGPAPAADPDPRVEALLQAVLPTADDLRLPPRTQDQPVSEPVLDRLADPDAPDPCDPLQLAALPGTEGWVAARGGRAALVAASWEQSLVTQAWVYPSPAAALAAVDAVRARAPRCSADGPSDRARDARMSGSAPYTRLGQQYAWQLDDGTGRRRTGDYLWYAQGSVLLRVGTVSFGVAPERSLTGLLGSVRVRLGRALSADPDPKTGAPEGGVRPA